MKKKPLPVAAPLVAPTTPVQRAENFALVFQGNANALALAYGGPLYLVGSMLTGIHPGDIDLRCMVERADMENLFGDVDAAGVEWSPAKFWRAREELKQSRRLNRRWLSDEKRRLRWGARFDFQLHVSLTSSVTGLPIMRDDKPSLRLDKVPLEYFSAGRGDP